MVAGGLLDDLYTVGQVIVLLAGIAAIVTAPLRVIFSRPRIQVRPRQWRGRGREEWTFATVEIRNAPLPPFLDWLIARQTAYECRVQVEFRSGGELKVEAVDARWSARPEPLRYEPVTGAATIASQFGGAQMPPMLPYPAPELIPGSMVYDLPPSSTWLEVAVAVLRDFPPPPEAYAFGAWSYMHPFWRNPDWKLERCEYDVTVRVSWGHNEVVERFKLPFLSLDFSKFEIAAA